MRQKAIVVQLRLRPAYSESDMINVGEKKLTV